MMTSIPPVVEKVTSFLSDVRTLFAAGAILVTVIAAFNKVNQAPTRNEMLDSLTALRATLHDLDQQGTTQGRSDLLDIRKAHYEAQRMLDSNSRVVRSLCNASHANHQACYQDYIP